MAETNNLAEDAAFLCVEIEGDKVGVGYVSGWGGGEGEGLAGKFQRDIAETERGGFRRTDRVFAGAKEKEEREGNHVANGLIPGVRRCVRDHECLRDDRDGKRFDSRRWGVLFGIRAKLALEAKVDAVVGVEAGVRGPHAAERLRNSAYGVLHAARLDRAAAGGECALAASVGEDLKKRDGIVNFAEGRIDVEGLAKIGPGMPTGYGELGSANHDSGIDGAQDSAEITAELKLGVGW